MSITLTSNYQQTLEADTLAQIKALEEEEYDLGAMLEFIDENSEKAFRFFYETYVELGEEHGYEAVDAFIKLAGVDFLDNFEDAYLGEFSSPTAMAEEYFEWEVESMDHRIAVDWHETAEYLLAHDVDQTGNFYFRCEY